MTDYKTTEITYIGEIEAKYTLYGFMKNGKPGEIGWRWLVIDGHRKRAFEMICPKCGKHIGLWKHHVDTNEAITVSPSVGHIQHFCKAHFFIKNGKLQILTDMDMSKYDRYSNT